MKSVSIHTTRGQIVALQDSEGVRVLMSAEGGPVEVLTEQMLKTSGSACLATILRRVRDILPVVGAPCTPTEFVLPGGALLLGWLGLAVLKDEEMNDVALLRSADLAEDPALVLPFLSFIEHAMAPASAVIAA